MLVEVVAAMEGWGVAMLDAPRAFLITYMDEENDAIIVKIKLNMDKIFH